MLKHTVLALVVCSSTTAFAGGQEDSLGIGAEYMMNGLSGGASVNYDLGKMHFGGFLGFFDNGDEMGNDTSDYTLGGRFFYHVHSTAMSDFGLGGALGFYSDEVRMGMDTDRSTYLFLEPGVQIRMFPVANVALSFGVGVVLALQDEDGFAIGGGTVGGRGSNLGIGGAVTGSAGIHYYFF